MTLPQQAHQTSKEHNMLSPGDHVLIGLSGGADSVALLHWLCAICEEFQLTLIVVHVNHGLRGAASDHDEQFCRDLCAKLGKMFHVKHFDIAARAKAQGMGLEEAGREARYAFFDELCKSAPQATKIALAHTLSDRAETFLLNVARGAALRGLCSIPPTRGRIIRPLIDCTRAQVEAYCTANGLDYCTDSTNQNNSYRRNYIRNEVLPKLNWNADSLRRMFAALMEDETYLQQQASQLAQDEILTVPPPLKNRALRQMLVDTGREPSQARMQELEKQLYAQPAGPAFLPPAVNRALKITHFTNNSPDIHKQGLANCLDYDTIVGVARESRRKPGDCMRLVNGVGSKSFKKLCQERGIAPAAREHLLVLRDDAGLVWMEGFGCAHRCRVTKQSQRVVKVTVEESASGGTDNAGID